MKLEELLPESPSFELKSTGKTYHLRIPNLSDRARFTEILGTDQEKITEVFQKMHWETLSKLVYRLLVEKEDFQGSIETELDDDGFSHEVRVTGPEKLMRAVTGGLGEAMKMLNALVLAMRAGDPLIDQAVTDSSEKKKAPKLSGATSSTSSARSTATHQSSSHP